MSRRGQRLGCWLQVCCVAGALSCSGPSSLGPDGDHDLSDAEAPDAEAPDADVSDASDATDAEDATLCLEEERCDDGVDNDCDGEVDEGCEPCLCIPGASRYCYERSYGRLGTQSCLPDGMSWSRCEEDETPTECAGVASWYNPGLVLCLVEQLLCCQDQWDLDADGDTGESLGSCGEVLCLEPEEERCGDLFDNDLGGLVDEGCDCDCAPDQWRYCEMAQITNWGTQRCAQSGLAWVWGYCEEVAEIPEACDDEGWYSPEAPQCCVDNGLCCQDSWDIDGDGDTWETVGCPPPQCLDDG